jgi:hypothetical protein
VPVWYVAPLDMNEGTNWGQAYNRSIKAAVPKKGPIKRPLTLTFLAMHFVAYNYHNKNTDYLTKHNKPHILVI